MPGMREDYMLRMIREAVQIVARLAGLRREGLFAGARDELARAKALIAADTGPVLDRVDAGSAAHLLGDPRRALAYAQILAEEAALERVAGNAERAAWAGARAATIARILAARDEPPAGTAELLAALDADDGPIPPGGDRAPRQAG